MTSPVGVSRQGELLRDSGRRTRTETATRGSVLSVSPHGHHAESPTKGLIVDTILDGPDRSGRNSPEPDRVFDFCGVLYVVPTRRGKDDEEDLEEDVVGFGIRHKEDDERVPFVDLL